MPHEVIIIKKNATGKYFFIIRDAQDTQLATSKSFESEEALKQCLTFIQLSLLNKHSETEVVDLIFKKSDLPKDHSFLMMTLEGEVLIQSYSFLSQEACQRALNTCKNAFIHIAPVM